MVKVAIFLFNSSVNNMLQLQELQVALVLSTIESNSSVSFFSTKFILLNNFALPVRYSNNLSDISRRNDLLDFFHFFLCFNLISQHLPPPFFGGVVEFNDKNKMVKFQ